MQPSIREYVFISYSHKDKEWLDKLQTMLAPLVRKGIIKTWADTQIEPGAQWQEEVNKALTTAKVAVLLVTPEFLASDFIARHELPPLLQAAEKEGLTVLWIALSACMYKFTWLVNYQAAHDPTCPLDSLNSSEQNRELVRIGEKIRQAIDTHPPDLNTGLAAFDPSYSQAQVDDTAIKRCVPKSSQDSISSSTRSTLSQLQESGDRGKTLFFQDHPVKLSQRDRRDLVRSLLTCPCISDNSAREAVIRELPQQISRTLTRSQRQDIDVQNLVHTCENYPGGLEYLINVVRTYDEGTWEMEAVDKVLKRFLL